MTSCMKDTEQPGTLRRRDELGLNSPCRRSCCLPILLLPAGLTNNNLPIVLTILLTNHTCNICLPILLTCWAYLPIITYQLYSPYLPTLLAISAYQSQLILQIYWAYVPIIICLSAYKFFQPSLLTNLISRLCLPKLSICFTFIQAQTLVKAGGSLKSSIK